MKKSLFFICDFKKCLLWVFSRYHEIQFRILPDPSLHKSSLPIHLLPKEKRAASSPGLVQTTLPMEYVNARYVYTMYVKVWMYAKLQKQQYFFLQVVNGLLLLSSLIISYNMENKNRPPMPTSPPPDLPETYKRTKFGDPYGK